MHRVRRDNFNNFERVATNRGVLKEGGNDNSQKPIPCAKNVFDVHQTHKLFWCVAKAWLY